MLEFFINMSSIGMLIIYILIVGSFFIRNFWCRYFCPYGVLVGIIGLFSPTKIKRNEETCIECNLCSEVCPSYLPVDKKPQIISIECTGCISCTEVCPVKNTLEFQTIGLRSNYWTPRKVAFTISGIFIVSVLIAKIFGFWNSELPLDEVKTLLPNIDRITH